MSMPHYMKIGTALEKGYVHAVRQQDLEDVACCKKIAKLTHADFEDGTVWVVCDIEPMVMSIDIDSLMEWTAESAINEEFGVEYEEVAELLADIDFKGFAEKVNAALAKKKFYNASNIQLLEP